jgi:hypothetical protein
MDLLSGKENFSDEFITVAKTLTSTTAIARGMLILEVSGQYIQSNCFYINAI